MPNQSAAARVARKLNLRPTGIVLLLLTFVSAPAFADPPKGKDWVEIRRVDDTYLPYRQRRGGHDWYFAANYENYRPTDFVSEIDGAGYSDTFGTTNVGITSFEAGYKFNLAIGGIAVLGTYGTGAISNVSSGETRDLSVTRMGLKGMFVMDTIWPEPYAAPYASVGIFRYDNTEKIEELGLSQSGTTAPGLGFSVGVLCQLNWIEEEVSKQAHIGTGMENVFLDLFLSQYANTQSGNDPGMGSSFNWGAGLRLEF